MTQHGGGPGSGWLVESDPAGWLCCEGRYMPPSLTDSTAWSGLELISGKLLTNSRCCCWCSEYWMYTKHRHELYHTGKAWVKTLVRPCHLSGENSYIPTEEEGGWTGYPPPPPPPGYSAINFYRRPKPWAPSFVPSFARPSCHCSLYMRDKC